MQEEIKLWVKKFKNDGYVIVKDFLPKKNCQELVLYLDGLPAKVNLPFTNVPWGYGNLLNQGPFKLISENNLINTFCKNIFDGEYTFNHLMVHNKAPWIGAGIEWHQEVFNISTYAPGYTAEDWQKFAQIYVALEDQDLEDPDLVPQENSKKRNLESSDCDSPESKKPRIRNSSS